jgi:hypothetical protein
MFRPQLPLETERLTLRPFEDGDADALHAIQRRPRAVQPPARTNSSRAGS